MEAAPTISLSSHQNIGLHTGARANVVLLTYLRVAIELIQNRWSHQGFELMRSWSVS